MTGKHTPGQIAKAVEIVETRFRETGRERVMVQRYKTHQARPARGVRRHLKVYSDDGGLYVRIGKRAAVKRYLHDMACAKVVCRNPDVVKFYET